MIRCGVPLKRATIFKLLKEIDTDGVKTIDYKELVSAHKRHQNVVRQYMKDGVKFEDTQIGRVSLLLRKLMKKDVIMKKRKEGQETVESEKMMAIAFFLSSNAIQT